MTQISLELPDEWIAFLDKMANEHTFGAKNRQDVIRAILAESIKVARLAEVNRIYPSIGDKAGE